jgi:outer membrane protein OmpA-like peptidoglycan-associated protein
MRKLIIALFLLTGLTALAQEQQANFGRRLIEPSKKVFLPHWYAGVQAGGAYDIGEAKFSDLLSPAAQLSVGYQFIPALSARLSLSGLWARNKYAFPEAKYKWNFIQPALELKADVASIIWGWNPDRIVSPYLFAGVGAAYEWNNDEAIEADQRYGIDFQKLWKDNRWNPVVRAGVGADFRLNDRLSLAIEANGNMLPDHFNSKRGRNDNRDWHFNALVGVKVNLGKTYRTTEPVYETLPLPQPAPVVEEQPKEKIQFTVNIQFVINQSIIRANQIPKLKRLLAYLEEHPTAYVRLTGYADKETGTPQINDRLSRERAAAVAQYIMDEGINESRIRKFAKGDRVQPFEIPEDNRVTICFVYEPIE